MVLVHLQSGERVTTTRVNEAELRVGIYLANDATEERARVERVLEPLELLDLDSISTERFTQAKAHLITINRLIKNTNLLVTTITLVHGQTLITRNPQHFIDIPKLTMESY